MNQRKLRLPRFSPSGATVIWPVEQCGRGRKHRSGQMERGENPKTPESSAASRTDAHLLHAVVEEGQAGVLVADEGALLDEADEDLSLGELGVELLVRSVSAFQKTCGTPKTDCRFLEPSGKLFI